MWYQDADNAIGVHPMLATLPVAKNMLCHALSLWWVAKHCVSASRATSFSSRYSMMYSNSVILSLMTSASSPWEAAVRGNPGASVEAMRRLRESIDKLRTSSARYAIWMLWLTVALTILTAAQLVSVVEIIRTWVAG